MRSVLMLALTVVTASWGSGLAQSPETDAETSPVIPIGQTLTDRDGDTVPDLLGRAVHVRGVVTVPSGVISDAYLQAFIQDETGGVFIFDRKVERELDLGDYVNVVARIDQYRGAVQLINPVYEVIGTRELPEPKAISIAEAASWESYGRLVKVQGVLGESESRTTILVPLRATPENEAAKIDVFIPRKVDRGMTETDYPPGATVSVVGEVSRALPFGLPQ